jgi:type VI secretion system protein VasJ
MQPDPIGFDPIPGAQPAGEDVRDTDEFAAIQAEFAKQFNPELNSVFDPNRVINLATVLLTTKGKNLLVCSYLVSGLSRQNKIVGLNQGLGSLINMIDHFWETLFPALDRIRARRNAIDWLRTDLTSFLSDTQFDPVPSALIESVKDRIKLLDQKLSDRDPDTPPLRSLLSYVDQVPILAEKIPEVTKVHAVEGNNSGATISADAVASGSAGGDAQSPNNSNTLDTKVPEMQTPADALKALDIFNSGLLRVADLLLTQNILDPLPFRVLRMAMWSSVVDYPTLFDGRTQIPPPIPQLRTTLITMAGNPSPNDLIIFCESQAANSWFWLDVHRVAEESLNKLGASGEAAAKEIRLAVSNLIIRFPDLPSYLFSDGSPFADPETQSWIEGLSPSNTDARLQGSGKGKPGGDAVNLQATLAEAQKQIVAGLWPAAIKTMQAGVNIASNDRERLLARTQLLGILLTKEPPINTTPIAEGLLEVIDRHQLISWEPELALNVMKTAYLALARDVNAADLASQTLGKIGQISDQELFNLLSSS